jgi:hypothetical protein
MNNTVEQQGLQRIMLWRKIEIKTPYPESPMPQNDIILQENAAHESTFDYRHTEVQIGN